MGRSQRQSSNHRWSAKWAGGAALTFIYPYYNNSQDLCRQLETWSGYPRWLRERLQLIVVDDGSPTPLTLEETPPLNLSIYRITEDRGYNNGGARNLGAHVAADGWLLFSDIDHRVPVEVCAALVGRDLSGRCCYYTFQRTVDGRPHHAHPNTFLIHRAAFWQVGGYDEDLSGCYGGDDVLLRALMDRQLKHVALDLAVESWGRPSYDAPAQEPRRAEHVRNRPVIEEKLSRPGYRPQRPLRFGWEKVAEFRWEHRPNRRRSKKATAGRDSAAEDDRELLYQQACHLAEEGKHEEARQRYRELEGALETGALKALVHNDLAALAAAAGDLTAAREGFRLALEIDAQCDPAQQNLARLQEAAWEDLSPEAPGEPWPPACGKVALVSFLFNWPSTGGGIVHTVELAQFLARAGFEVRHFYARYPAWGVGKVSEVPLVSEALEFDEATWNVFEIQARFRTAVRAFDPDHVIVTDSWNFKPLLAEAIQEYPYLLRFQAMECLCPLNNVRLLPPEEGKGWGQCQKHQLATPQQCCACLAQRGKFSGSLHQAERALSGVGTREYHARLVRVLKKAEVVLVVNPLMEAMIAPYARCVKVVTAGMDPARFPWPAPQEPPLWPERKVVRLFFAGLVDEPMKGFGVLQEACRLLRRRRQDFELVATGEPAGAVNDHARFVGWLSQEQLPRYLRASDVCMVPTIAQEALGRTAVEAMAAGRAVIASRIGGLPFTVREGETGLLCRAGDVEDLAEKIARLLDDAALRARMGQAGRRRFEEHYAWPVIIQRHYRPLLTARRAPLQAVAQG